MKTTTYATITINILTEETSPAPGIVVPVDHAHLHVRFLHDLAVMYTFEKHFEGIPPLPEILQEATDNIKNFKPQTPDHQPPTTNQ